TRGRSGVSDGGQQSLPCPLSTSPREDRVPQISLQQRASKLLLHKLLTGSGTRRQTGHEACLSEARTPMAGDSLLSRSARYEHPSAVIGGTDAMAEAAYTRNSALVPTTRERLKALDDAAVVESFLGGDERAFQELV